MPAFTEYSIAAGWNNAAGLVRVGLITPSSHIAFHEPIARPNFSPGIRRIRMDGRTYSSGYPSTIWIFGFMSFKHYDYLRTTYCAGGFSGEVTIKTRYLSTAFDDYNAVINVPFPETLQSTGIGFQNVPVPMTRLIALP